jgi:hypothetical protein
MCAKLPENAPPEGIKLLCAAANRHGFACKSNRAMGNLIEGGNALIVKPQVTQLSISSVAVQESRAKSNCDVLARGQSTASI